MGKLGTLGSFGAFTADVGLVTTTRIVGRYVDEELIHDVVNAIDKSERRHRGRLTPSRWARAIWTLFCQSINRDFHERENEEITDRLDPTFTLEEMDHFLETYIWANPSNDKEELNDIPKKVTPHLEAVLKKYDEMASRGNPESARLIRDYLEANAIIYWGKEMLKYAAWPRDVKLEAVNNILYFLADIKKVAEEMDMDRDPEEKEHYAPVVEIAWEPVAAWAHREQQRLGKMK